MIFYDLVFCIWYCTLEIGQIHDPGLTLCVANGYGNDNDDDDDDDDDIDGDDDDYSSDHTDGHTLL